MTKITLEAAGDIVQERLLEADTNGDPDSLGASLTADSVQKMLAGTDITLDEIMAFADERATIAIAGVVKNEAPLFMALSGLVFDGILTGIVYAEARQAEKNKPS